MKQFIPNPDGRLGSQEHRDKVEDVANEIKNSGFDAVKEFLIELFSGKRKYIDVASVDDNGNPVEFHQIGRTNKNGEPVIRERRNKEEIEEGSGIKVTIHPFFKVMFISFIVVIMLVIIAKN